jgi:hypothetical protein
LNGFITAITNFIISPPQMSSATNPPLLPAWEVPLGPQGYNQKLCQRPGQRGLSEQAQKNP